VELYLHSANALSWRGVQLKKAQGQFYLLPLPLPLPSPLLVDNSELVGLANVRERSILGRML
jgi:hypothetical protein